MSKLILGLAGEIASGKTTVANYLKEEQEIGYYRFSDPLRDTLDRMHIEPTRENMQLLSTVMRKHFGEDLLAKIVFRDVENDEHEVIAVDGVRRLEDIKYLTELPDFKLVYIDADLKARYERIVGRGENPDDNTKTFEDFKKDNLQEAELEIRELKAHADIVLDNNGDTDALYAQIDALLTKERA